MTLLRRVRALPAAAIMVLLAALVATAFPPAPPNDPDYAAIGPCPGNPLCATPTGQWNLFSTSENFPATLHASGISADLAWDVTLGTPETVVVVLDSGVNYDHVDLRNQIWLNRGELPVPNGVTCTPPAADLFDCNNDGVFNILDYSDDSRITDTILPGTLSRSDLRVFQDGSDDDNNGFIDDISGWDADDDDGDEYDHRDFGHGTGRNGFIAAETDNGVGIAGICPKCRLSNVRVDDTFVHKTEGAMKGAIWAADHGHSVICMALGATGAASATREAFEYATHKNVLAVSASANEFSFHHNFQTVFDDVMAIGGVVPDNENGVSTYLRKANFSNFGAHLDVVTPSDSPTTSHGGGFGDSSGTSSAVPHAAGAAAMVFSRARELIELGTLDTTGLSLADISAQEVRQIINRTADDIDIPDDPSGPYTNHLAPGWDRYTGYGRVNVRSAVDLVAAGTIPPEADINSPDWYSLVDGVPFVFFYANARWATSYDYVLEVGRGIQPTSFTTVDTGTTLPSNKGLSSASMTNTHFSAWDTTVLAVGIHTLRLRVTDNLGNVGEDRMTVWVSRGDPDDHPGFPIDFTASMESISSKLVDLNGDNKLEIVVSDADGRVHAFRQDGSELPGFPVSSDPLPALPTCCSEAFDGITGNGEVTVVGSSIIGGVSVGDIDNDSVQEICAGAYDGKLYCWNADGSVQPGFPVSADLGTTRDQYSGALIPNAKGDPILAPPAMVDMDSDGTLELVAGTFDQKLYVWNSDGTRRAPFPIEVFDPAEVSGPSTKRPEAIISVPVVADIDLDGDIEMVFGTNETYGTPNVGGQGGSGRVYAIDENGSIEAGWPVAIASISPDSVPLVAEGHGTSLAAADIDGDGTLEMAGGLLFADATIFNHDGSVFSTMNGAMGGSGAGGDGDEETPEGGLGKPSDGPVRFYVAHGAFSDIDADTVPDYMAGTVGVGIGSVALASGAPAPFDHYISAWNSITGSHKAAFPRVIEDWQFFTSPGIGDIDGAVDGLPELVVASGGFFVHAINALGVEAAGWPKHTGAWTVTTPMLGDIDDDGLLEVVVTTRLGSVHVWDTPASACAAGDTWRTFHHDEWNTGVLGTDTRRPARVDDLGVDLDSGGATLSWTAPGDDGRCGTATTYEIYTADFPMSEGNLGGAIALAAPSPAAGGTAEQISVAANDVRDFFAIRAIDEVGNAGPLTSVGGFDVERVSIKKTGGIKDRMTLKASIATVPAALGLPGASLTLSLVDAIGTVHTATVPGNLLVANSKGNRLKFSDRTGNVANGLATLKLVARKGATTRLVAKIKGGDLSAAQAGSFIEVLEIGAIVLSDSGSLRIKGTRLVFP